METLFLMVSVRVRFLCGVKRDRFRLLIVFWSLVLWECPGFVV